MPSFTYSSCSTTNMVVEELLELLIDKVDGDLLEAVVLEDLEAGDVEDSTEVGFLQAGIDEGVVALLNQPLEETVKDGPGNATDGSSGLIAGLTLGHPLGADLDPGLAEHLDHLERVDLERASCFSRESVRTNELALSLVVTTLGLELDSTTGHHTGGQHVAVKLLLVGESKHVEGILGVEELFIVVDGIDLGLALGHMDVIVDVVRDEALGSKAA